MKSEVGYGQRLRSAREARGLSPSAVAEKLHLRTDIVLAIEQEDQQQHLLAPAFVRGYIRAYSQLVAENADELVVLFNRHAGNDPELTQLETIDVFRENSGAILRWGGIAVSAILLVVLAFWLHDYLQKQPMSLDAIIGDGADEPAEVDVADSSIEPALDKIMIEHAEAYSGPDAEEIEDIVQMVSRDQTGGVETVSETVATAGTDSGEPVLAATIEAAPAQSKPQNDNRNEVVSLAPTGGDRLHIAFDGSSWIEATDANGFRLIYGLFDEQDRQLSVRGKAPFRIIVGDTNNVEIRVNNTKHELRTYSRPNNSARVLFGDQNQRNE